MKCTRSFIPHSHSGMDRTPFHPFCPQGQNEQNVANAFCTNHFHSRIVNKKRALNRSLLEAFHSIGKSLDKGTETDIAYLDFAKAFDSVCHARLLAKLRSFGITSPLLDWFWAYLFGRRQRVVINGTHSSWMRVGSGVSQGSILCPILFLLYINDMPDVVTNSLIVMFANDAKCFKVIDS